MNGKIIIRSLFHIRNLGLLAVVLILTKATGWIPLFFIGLPIYFLLVFLKANSSKFQEKCIRKEKLRKIGKLNTECMRYWHQVKRKVARDLISRLIGKVSSFLGKENLTDLESRVIKIWNIKEEIMNAFLFQGQTPIKEKVAFRVVELATVYFRLMDGYASRLAEVGASNFNSIEARLEANRRKLSMSSKSHFSDDLKRAIETDERLLQRLKEEKCAVEKMDAKLNVIESTMLLLKQQYYAEVQSDEVISDTEVTINEAIALDNALNHHIRLKKRL